MSEVNCDRELYKERLERNLVLACVMSALNGAIGFLMPSVIFLWQEHGFSMHTMTQLEAYFAASLIGFSLVSGPFADTFGRRRSLLAGSCALVSGAGTYCVAASFEAFLLGEILLAAGLALSGAAQRTILYESLAQLGRSEERDQMTGRVQQLMPLVGAVANLSGAALAGIHLRLPVIVVFAAMLAMIPTCMLLEEPRYRAGPSPGFSGLVRFIRKNLLKDSQLRWMLVYLALIMAGSRLALLFYTPFFEQGGVSALGCGLFFFSFNLIAALSYRSAAAVKERGGAVLAPLSLHPHVQARMPEQHSGWHFSLLAPFAVLVASYAAMGSGWFVLGCVLMYGIQWVRGYTDVIYSGYLDERSSADSKATVLSLMSVMSNCFYAAALPHLGWLKDTSGVQSAFMTTALWVGVAGIVLLAIHPRARSS